MLERSETAHHCLAPCFFSADDPNNLASCLPAFVSTGANVVLTDNLPTYLFRSNFVLLSGILYAYLRTFLRTRTIRGLERPEAATPKGRRRARAKAQAVL